MDRARSLLPELAASLIVLVLVAALPTGALAQESPSTTGTLRVVVTGCPSDDGSVHIGLVDRTTGFGTDANVRAAIVPVRTGRAEYVFDALPHDTYAVRVFHDANGNETLDTDFFGRPTEAYGFSNDARGRFGPPDFEAAAFALQADSLTVAIAVR